MVKHLARLLIEFNFEINNIGISSSLSSGRKKRSRDIVNFAEFKFKVIAITQNESVHLEIVESEFDNVGHIMKYDLDENDGKTRVRFTYEGFGEMDDSYANMNYSSAKYLESLRQYCQAGNGEAFGSPSYRS